ncbi:MAG: hypothetical protein E6J41_30315 [Chloroflexi bacterium]|nr:MAG: hypothetical protein E6J41_30315 [Chloroflexota bacterium]
MPVAGCHVAPLSVDTSTPATTPPPASVAVPVMVTVVPLVSVAPDAGEVMVEVGAVWSVDAVAATRPACIVVGWTPMSAIRLSVACCMLMSGSAGPMSGSMSWLVSRPHAHWTVPAPNTSAPLAARYSVRWCVATACPYVLP